MDTTEGQSSYDEGVPAPARSVEDDGFSPFFRRELEPVRRAVQLIVGDRAVAQELTQDAFVEALRRWDVVRDYDRPGAWVRRVAIRRAMQARHRHRAGIQLAQGQATGHAEPADLDLRRAVAALPRAQRAAVALFYLEDRPAAEVAELMGCSPATVKVHLHRARKTLATALGAGDQTSDEESR